jgi:RNA polymerase sigma-70 factor, ECF subfamily
MNTATAANPATLFGSACVRAGQRRLAQDPEVPALVAAYARADTDARRAAASHERLVALCRPAAEQIARTYVSGEADVADVTQEALITLTFRLPQLRDPYAFPQWFAAVVRNAARQHLRRERGRRGQLSLDAPSTRTRAFNDEDSSPGFTRDLIDPAAAEAFSAAENRLLLQRLLRLVPHEQRAALTLSYIEGLSHDQIGRELRLSARAVEGLAYRGIRRLQVITGQCTEEPEEMLTWCGTCRRPLVSVLEAGWSPSVPFEQRIRCAGCTPPGVWLHIGTASYGRYASLDDVLEVTGIQCAHQVRRWAQRKARGDDPRCWRCTTPLVYGRFWWSPPWRRGGQAKYMLSWQCLVCPVEGSPVFVQLSSVGSALDPRWRAFTRSAPRRVYGPERLITEGGEERLVVTAFDPDTGRHAEAHVACEALTVRTLEITAA